MIKKTLIALTILITCWSCDQVDELTMFDIDYTTAITIPATSIIEAPIEIITPETTTNSEAEYDNNNTNADLRSLVVRIPLRPIDCLK